MRNIFKQNFSKTNENGFIDRFGYFLCATQNASSINGEIYFALIKNHLIAINVKKDEVYLECAYEMYAHEFIRTSPKYGAIVFLPFLNMLNFTSLCFALAILFIYLIVK